MSTIVVGLGNPVLGDDAIGWRILQEVGRQLEKGPPQPTVELCQVSLGGISLMETLSGYSKAIVVDALVCENSDPGRLHRIGIDDLPELKESSRYMNSTHDISFQAALRLGDKLAIPLPSEVVIIAVEIAPRYELSETLSAEVEASIQPAARLILEELDR